MDNRFERVMCSCKQKTFVKISDDVASRMQYHSFNASSMLRSPSHCLDVGIGAQMQIYENRRTPLETQESREHNMQNMKEVEKLIKPRPKAVAEDLDDLIL